MDPVKRNANKFKTKNRKTEQNNTTNESHQK